MILLGFVLVAAGLVAGLPAVLYAGLAVLVVGLVLLVLGQTGHRVGGRRHYF